MICENFVFDLPSTGLFYAANRYAPEDSNNDRGVTLVMAHCTSAHKEHWEVTVRRLFELSSDAANPSHCVRDAWCLDCQSHGDSAVLNEAVLSSSRLIRIEDYAALLHHFIKSGHVDPCRTVAVGHSSSTSAWILACLKFPAVPLHSIILIEPVLIAFPDHDNLVELGKARVKGVLSRRDRWSDIEAASVWLRKRHPWKTWDLRIFEIYIKYGFKNMGESTSEVTTKCTTAQESTLYTHEPRVLAGSELHKVCQQVPVHAIFAESPEFVSLKARNATCDASAGRIMASISIVAKAGHLAVQEKPEEVAVAIFQALFQSKAKDTTTARM